MAQIEPTKVQLACNALRALFFDPAYKGVISKHLIKIALETPAWCKAYGRKTLQKAWLQLQDDGYVYLKNNDVWIWGIPGSDLQEEHEKRYARMLRSKKKIRRKSMTLQDLHKLVDNAPEETLRNCLKEILEHWFVNPEDNTVDPVKAIWPEIILAVTGVLQNHGFYPDSDGTEGQEPQEAFK